MAHSKVKFQIKSYAIAALLALTGCTGATNNSAVTADLGINGLEGTLAKPNPILKVSLTDAPNKDLKAVFVNVAQIEIFLKKYNVEKRLVVGKDLGPVDLLQLTNGVLLPISEAQIPNGVEVREIRLVLNDDQNYAVEMNDQICPMQTPSGQQSGVKIKLGTPFVMEAGFSYSLVVDFDAKKSVVVKGNGECLLKPVIKIPAVTKTAIIIADDPADDNGGTVIITDPTSEPEIPVTDGNDTNVLDPTSPYLDSEGIPLPPDQLGFDPSDPSTYPPEVTVEDLYMYF